MGKIIPFRRRAPSASELEAFQRITRSWSPALKRLLCPQYFPFAPQPVRAARVKPPTWKGW